MHVYILNLMLHNTFDVRLKSCTLIAPANEKAPFGETAILANLILISHQKVCVHQK